METRRNVSPLWLLLLLHVSESAFNFQMFKGNPEAQEGSVRLFGSQDQSEGRVEIYHGGRWGTVCDDSWDMAEAQVVCRQLNFPGAKSVVIGKDYGPASGPIWLDDIKCVGTEKSLYTCAVKSWGVTDCSHKEDVGVICESKSAGETIDDSTHSLDHSIGLSNDLGKIFDSGNGCDFLILVQSATGNKHENGTLETTETTICAHKIILSLFPLFVPSGGNSSITVNIDHSCKPYFTSFIRYIYTRQIDVTFSSAQCLHWMASKFGVKQLMEETGRLFSVILPEDASFQTQLSLLEYANETGDLVLQENCIQYLAWNFQNLTQSAAWISLSVEVLEALLARSDLVLPDEYFLLQIVEGWILEKGNLSSFETQVDLLNLIRFPMIPVEKLYELEDNSLLYNAHKAVYGENILKALQFNVLLFNTLVSHPKFVRDDVDYHPRIYTADPWSTTIDPSRKTNVNPFQNRRNRYQNYDYRYNRYGYPSPTFSPYGQTMPFITPVHNSMIFKANTIQWQANILKTQRDCSNRGQRCESVPMAMLVPQNSIQQGNISFNNQLLLMCQGKYICQVQEFKQNQAYFAGNDTQVTSYPCADDQYTFRFVVRPEYV